MTTPLLFTPYRLGALEVPNRLWVAPMCQYSVEPQDGVPTDWHIVHLGSMAAGGAGLVMAEATAVLPEGRISPWDVGLWNDDQRDAWAMVAGVIRARGAVAAIQLAHAGRKASTWRPWSAERGSVPETEGGWTTVAPSALAFPGFAEPRALVEDEIRGVIAAFVNAAVRAVEAGFQVLEIHAAHGYLIHQFLSPLSNVREDGWGGPLENRARMLRSIVRGIHQAIEGEAEIVVRFSATDYLPGGWDAEQTATVAAWVQEDGARFVDVSTGGLLPAAITLGPGYQVPFSASVREQGGVPASAVGLITEAQQAEDILQRGDADVIMMGRQFLREPHFAHRAAAELGLGASTLPPQYARAPWPEAEPARG